MPQSRWDPASRTYTVGDRSVSEGAVFRIPNEHVDGRPTLGVVVRLDPQGNALVHLFRASEASGLEGGHPDLVTKVVAESFLEGRWPLLKGRLPERIEHSWTDHWFRHRDLLIDTWWLRRYADDDLLMWSEQHRASERECEGVPDDGIRSEQVVEARLAGLG